jgi:hypothetical protein
MPTTMVMKPIQSRLVSARSGMTNTPVAWPLPAARFR